MATLSPTDLLHVWEAGADADPVARAVLLAAAAGAGSVECASDLPLGARDALLVDLRLTCFGDDLPCQTTCPGCGVELDVTVTAAELQRAASAAVSTVEAAGRRLTIRPLNSRDVLDVDRRAGDVGRRLVLGCVLALDGRDLTETDDVPDEVIAAAAAALSVLDPGADLCVDLTCPVCGQSWPAPFDVPDHLWAELDDYARRLLGAVHTLALAYGWREDDVLALSPARRRFYLEAVS